jgi:branched-chain amino acid aminotransferase
MTAQFSPYASDAEFGPGIAFVDGAFRPLSEARISIFDFGFLRSDACQDTVSSWKGTLFRLDDHLDRFARNVAKLRMTCPYDRDQLRDLIFEALRRTGLRDAYIQIIMTRGRPPPGVRDPRRCANQFLAFCRPYLHIATPEVQARGIKAIISSICRIPAESVDPMLKTYHWLDLQMAQFEAFDRGADTAVVVDRDGNIAEGPGFNIFAVVGGEVLTPEGSCLDGMTRATVFDLCSDTNLTARAVALPPDILRGADEVFITSTAGGIMPIACIDDRRIGDGSLGPVTARLRELYWRRREAGWLGTKVTYRDPA